MRQGDFESAGPGQGKGKPASLETNPGSIRGARVTAKGAVQTLPQIWTVGALEAHVLTPEQLEAGK